MAGSLKFLCDNFDIFATVSYLRKIAYRSSGRRQRNHKWPSIVLHLGHFIFFLVQKQDDQLLSVFSFSLPCLVICSLQSVIIEEERGGGVTVHSRLLFVSPALVLVLQLHLAGFG